LSEIETVSFRTTVPRLPIPPPYHFDTLCVIVDEPNIPRVAPSSTLTPPPPEVARLSVMSVVP
jgi:hypothetical protein